MTAADRVDEHAYILWRIVGKTGWRYGRSIEGWVARDRDALSQQRAVVRENAREHEGIGDNERIQTRLFTATEAAEVGW